MFYTGLLILSLLTRLQFFFPNEIEWALHYVDKGLVSMIMAQPSNRCCYQVRPIEDQKQSGKSTSRESKTPYLCLNNRYCTCPDFETNVITKRSSQIVIFYTE